MVSGRDRSVENAKILGLLLTNVREQRDFYIELSRIQRRDGRLDKQKFQ